MQFFQTPHIDFLAKRKIAYILSGSLILIGIIAFIIRGFNLGIDFRGGTSILVRFEQDVETQRIRDALGNAGIGNSEIKNFGGLREYLIYYSQQKGVNAPEMAGKVEKALNDGLPGNPYQVLRTDTVGPKVGHELRRATVVAIFLSLIIILIYVGIRFEFVFSAGAIIALFHDVLVTLGVFCIFQLEISLKEIAAFLTIVGYSINDTIVIFDRIREDLKIYRTESLYTIINRSVNETLSRSIITSLTTFIVCVVLLIFGGGVIRGFSLAMTIGVFVGSYSTIFVASALVYDYQKKHGDKETLRMMKRKRA